MVPDVNPAKFVTHKGAHTVGAPEHPFCPAASRATTPVFVFTNRVPPTTNGATLESADTLAVHNG